MTTILELPDELSVGDDVYRRIRSDIILGATAAGPKAAARGTQGRVRRERQHATRDPKPFVVRGIGPRRGSAWF